MRILQYLILLLAVVASLPGCRYTPPESQFVYNERADELVRDAGDAVKEEIDSSFGTPKNSVAWLRLPVDYGTLKGQVVQVAKDESAGYQFKISFDTGEKAAEEEAELGSSDEEADNGEQADSVPETSLSGLAIRWTSGKYAEGAQIDGGRRDGEQLAALNVASWDKESGMLTLQQRMNPPPAKDDTFEIVGHKLSFGRMQYAAHCQHCHGVSGDGNGPTAKYLNPKPRDYRLGKFKFQSTPQTDRPTDDDLKRIILKGIPGTYMPSFLLLEDHELDSIVEYVKWLSMRGEYENKLINPLYVTYEKETFEQIIEDARESNPDDFDEKALREELLGPGSELAGLGDIAEQESEVLANAWKEMTIVVPNAARVTDSAESRSRGRVLYVKNCAACHGATGKGDGEQVEQYMKNDATNERYPEPGLFDDWGNPIKPRNLTRGIYRGGRRPIDLYRRIYAGINGTPMPPFKGKFNADDPKLDDAGIWDIVNYVYHIPFDANASAPSKSHTKHKTTAAVQSGRK